MRKVKFRKAERWTEGIYDCWDITDKIARAITQADCLIFINTSGVKCYGKDDQGYIVYGK